MLTSVRTKASPAALSVAILLTSLAAHAEKPAATTAPAGSSASQGAAPAATSHASEGADARSPSASAQAPAGTGAHPAAAGSAQAQVVVQEGPRASAPYPWAALIPFGGGQFLRGDETLGMFFGDSEVLLGTAAIGTAIWYTLIASNSVKTRNAEGKLVYLDSVESDLRSIGMANRLAITGWAALTAAGIFEALVNNRPKPRAGQAASTSSIHVSAGPSDGGAGVSLRIVF